MKPEVAYSVVPSLLHNDPTHPENNRRITDIIEAVSKAGLTERLTEVGYQIPATHEQIAAVHDPTYIDSLQQMMVKAPTTVDSAPTYITPQSCECALEAAGAGIAIVDTLLDDRVKSGFALLRPPGHHALPNRPMGFCLIGNIAVAARHAQQHSVKRILIIDFDAHHGNGTQDIFYTDSSVFFLSIHQSGIYPGSGRMNETGRRKGQGFTLNVPLPADSGDRGMQNIFSALVRPAAERFEPDLIMVSAGFDSHFSDPLSELQFTSHGYYALTNMLAELANDLCDGRLAFFLEGGYDLGALTESVCNVFCGLLGMPPVVELDTVQKAEPDLRLLISDIKSIHNL